MNLTSETKLFLGIVVATLAVIGAAIGLFSQPPPTFTKDQLIPKGTTTKGPENASAYLVEFSDFQCPACKAFQPTVDALVKQYPDKLLFAYRHFPLPQHSFAVKAALAAEAAARQGKFWETAALLFQNQDTFSDEFFSAQFTQFAKDMNDPVLADKIQKDKADGVRFWVNATPTFFLNGKKLTLSSFDELKRIVDNEMK